jgi:hypothetical protein
VSDLGIAFSGSGGGSEAVSLMRYTQQGVSLDQALVSATWRPGTTSLAGTWVPFVAVQSGVTTREVPGVAPAGTSVFATFLGENNLHYFASFSAGAWSPAAEAVLPSAGAQAAGPTPAGIAATGSSATLVYFANATNFATTQNRATAWQPAITLDNAGADESYVSTPSVVAMSGGTVELLTAFIRQTDGVIRYATRSAGTWSATAAVPGATAPSSTTYGPVERVGLAALPGGEAILGWRDRTTSQLYYSLYSGGVWSAAPAPIVSPNVVVSAAPSLTHGVAGVTAEAAFVESNGVAYHARLSAGVWAAPVVVGGTGLSHVTICTAP